MKSSMIWYIIMLSTQHSIAVWRVAYGPSRYRVDVVGNAVRTCLSCFSVARLRVFHGLKEQPLCCAPSPPRPHCNELRVDLASARLFYLRGLSGC